MELKLTKKSWLRQLVCGVTDRRLYRSDLIEAFILVCRGYSVDQIRSLRLLDNGYSGVCPDINRYLFSLNTNRFVWPLLHDKLLFDLYFVDKLPIARAKFFLIMGRVQRGSEEISNLGEYLVEHLQVGDGLLVKPLRGGEGKGIFLIRKRASNSYRVDHKDLELKEVLSRLECCEYHGIFPFIEQHATLKDLYPDATNTLRVVAFADRESGNVGFYSPRLRCGTSQSRPFDNTSMGGIACRIDEEKGITTRSCALDQGVFTEISEHPDTGKPLNGVQIPFWQDIRSKLTRFHQENPEFDLVGWDVLMGKKDWFVIEGNHNPTLRVNYFFDPIDNADQVFFRNHLIGLGILKPDRLPQ